MLYLRKIILGIHWSEFTKSEIAKIFLPITNRPKCPKQQTILNKNFKNIVIFKKIYFLLLGAFFFAINISEESIFILLISLFSFLVLTSVLTLFEFK